MDFWGSLIANVSVQCPSLQPDTNLSCLCGGSADPPQKAGPRRECSISASILTTKELLLLTSRTSICSSYSLPSFPCWHIFIKCSLFVFFFSPREEEEERGRSNNFLIRLASHTTAATAPYYFLPPLHSYRANKSRTSSKNCCCCCCRFRATDASTWQPLLVWKLVLLPGKRKSHCCQQLKPKNPEKIPLNPKNPNWRENGSKKSNYSLSFSSLGEEKCQG